MSRGMLSQTLMVNQLVDMEWKFGGILFSLFVVSILFQSMGGGAKKICAFKINYVYNYVLHINLPLGELFVKRLCTSLPPLAPDKLHPPTGYLLPVV